MNFDEILKSIGEFGPYQRFVYFLLCLPFLATGLQKFVWVFLITEPNYRCQLLIDRLPNGSTLPYDLPGEILNKTIPYDSANHRYATCMRYQTHVNSTSLVNNWTVYTEEVRFSSQSESCSSYVFDTSEYTSTLVSEFGLVCDHSWEQAHGQAILVVGELVAAIASGYLADTYGRRSIIMAGVCGYVVFGSLCACSQSHLFFILFRFLLGFSVACMILSSFVIIMEIVGPSHRMAAGNGCSYFYSTGYLLVLPFAYFIRNWRYLQFAITAPAIGILSLCWLLPESPRWLVANKKLEEAKTILQRVASHKNADLLKGLKSEDIEVESPPEKSYSHRSLFKYPKLRKRIIISCYLWFVSSGVYFGLSLNSSNLGGNIYINFLISAALEFPATFFTTRILRYFGRVRSLSAMFLIVGVSLVATSVVPPGNATILITLAMIGKFAAMVTYNTIYIHAGEVFPTVVRNMALGMCASCARIGGISAPYIALLSSVWLPLPLVVFGAESLIATGLALMLPETKDKSLPETILDGEMFGLNRDQCVG